MTAKLCAAALSCSLFLAACPAQAAGSDTITPKIGMGKNAAATTDDPFAIFRAKVDWINSGHLSGGAKTNMTRGMATSAPGGTVPSVAFPQQAADAIKNMDIEAQAKSMKDAGISDTQVEQFKQQMENLKKQVQGGTTSAVTSSARNTGFPQQSFITQTPLNSLPDNDGMKYNQNDQEATGKWAIGVAGDMATAVFFDSVSPGLLKAAGAAVSAYPHPLVLNNYA
ncbi:MAG: hypothetical protein FWC49_01090, partial [Proteobacteria bacterium]|nr:hypothetical protein [Pseudomonadota bacterium]